ncbi:MAG: tetratricopeptide repeat protein, partial [Bacteroidetes bacterium]|nr:tetratricopeptide repeat protein [Bacteroidota bacterium]
MMKHIVTIFLGLFIGHTLLGQMFADKDKALVRKGNKDYLNGSFVESEVNYKKALEENSRNAKAAFNLGDALYNQQRYEDAAAQFELASKLADDKSDKAEALHNLGNSLLKKQDFAKSIEAYKNALRLNPQDMDTKYNLAYAMQMMKQQQNQNQDNQDKENQDKNDQKNQDQQNQDQQDQEQKENQDQNEEKQEEQENENQQNQ